MIIDARHDCMTAAIWIVIASDKQARVYECAKVLKISPKIRSGNRYYYQESMETRLTPLPDEVWAAEHAPCPVISKKGNVVPLLSDETGEEHYAHYLRLVALKLGNACVHNRYVKLVIAAPPRMLGELKKQLTSATLARLTAEIPKELTQYNENLLLRHVEYILPRVYAS